MLCKSDKPSIIIIIITLTLFTWQVLDEIGIDVAASAAHAPSKKLAAQQQQQQIEEDEEALTARLAQLKG